MRTFNPANKLLSGKKREKKNGGEEEEGRVGVGDRRKPKCCIFWDSILNRVKAR